MNGPCRAHHVVSTEKIFSSATFFIFVQIGNVNSNRSNSSLYQIVLLSNDPKRKETSLCSRV